MKNHDNLDDVFDNTLIIGDISIYLEELSMAFRSTGNKLMADNLMDISETLKGAARNIRNSISKDSSQRLDEANKGIGKILSTMVEGLDNA